MEKETELKGGKVFIDNGLHITEQIICEYPVCLNFYYCDHFLNSIHERIELLYIQMHAVKHLKTEANPAVDSKKIANKKRSFN